MIGDVLLIEQKHERVARELAAKVNRRQADRISVAIGGESGSGKSEIAETLRSVLKTEDYRVKILHLDNYYKVAPSKRTEHRRKHGMSAVGLHEIDWELLEENIAAFREGKPTTIPFLDLYTDQEDKLVTNFKVIDILIIEGLYACNASVDIRVHIDLTYRETKQAQLKRKKERVDKFRFQVLEKEHREVTTLRPKTDYFVTPTFTLVDNTSKNTPLEQEDSGRYLFCSYGLPLSVHKRGGRYRFKERAGGVGNAIASVYSAYDSIWFGGIDVPSRYKVTDHKAIRRQLLSERNLHPLFYAEDAVQRDADAFCTHVLWPLFHYRPDDCVFRDDWWRAYKRFNRRYYDALRKHVRPNDTVWIHDYHLMLLPELLRAEFPDVTIGFFLHTPFPSFELFRLLPWRADLLRGVLGADLVGFHIYEYTRHFQSSVFRILGYESRLGSITTDSRLVHTDAFSLGVDYGAFMRLRKEAQVQKDVERLREQAGGLPVVLSIDRLDPSRGVDSKLRAIEHLLESHRRFRRKVVFFMRFFDGRRDADGKAYREDIERRIAACNRTYGDAKWTPIVYELGQCPQSELVALYNIADVLLVSSLRDGMNLIGKEYVAARDADRGVVVLSEFAGGARELAEAILINPYDCNGCVDALISALTMPARRQVRTFARMKQRQQRNTALRWSVEFIEGLKDVKSKQERIHSRAFTGKTTAQLLADFHSAERRLLVLDYNGTLVPVPADGRTKPPSRRVLDILAMLAENKRNRVAIVTDNRQSLIDDWFKDDAVDLLACSNAAYRRDGAWTVFQELSSDWQEEARPILERYVVRTPGSYIDEKQYALIWHFENAVKELGDVRSRELMDDLKSFTGMENLQINEGDRLIEIKNAETYKASMLKAYMGDDDWGFFLAAGDDESNEAMYGVLPPSAYTIHIGAPLTGARYNMPRHEDLLSLLEEIVNRD